MVFSSIPFLFIFLPVTLAIYYLLPKKLRNGWLLIASLFFYGYGEPVFILLMLASIIWNYLCGIVVGALHDTPKKLMLTACIVVNLCTLGYFKYTGLLLDTLKKIPLFSFLPNPDIALPIGISFYTFQTMSYVIDVYRKKCKTQKNIISFGTYVALFPQLIAGPIVRYVDVESQLVERRETPEMFAQGIRLFLVGLCKKLLIANKMGVIWDTVNTASASCGAVGHWFGILAFTLQIYFDFSGYSDMARGLGNMFGFNFVKNFDYPYISKSITEFWRRWHISLGTWFKEYVYIPLGGNKRGKFRQAINILIVWSLTGIWHGASWNFMIWGLYFGILLLLEKFFLDKLFKKLPVFFSHVYALIFIVFGWLIFQSPSVGFLFDYLAGMFSPSLCDNNTIHLMVTSLPVFTLATFACLPLGKRLYFKLSGLKLFSVLEAVAALVILLLCTAVMVSSTYDPFLYFRF